MAGPRASSQTPGIPATRVLHRRTHATLCLSAISCDHQVAGMSASDHVLMVKGQTGRLLGDSEGVCGGIEGIRWRSVGTASDLGSGNDGSHKQGPERASMYIAASVQRVSKSVSSRMTHFTSPTPSSLHIPCADASPRLTSIQDQTTRVRRKCISVARDSPRCGTSPYLQHALNTTTSTDTTLAPFPTNHNPPLSPSWPRSTGDQSTSTP